MLYTLTYRRKNIITEILNRKEVNDALKLFEETKNYYTLISVTPTTAEDIAGKLVDFLKDVCPFDYADSMEVGDSDVDMIAEYSANLIEDKTNFLKLVTNFFEGLEDLNDYQLLAKKDILKAIEEF